METGFAEAPALPFWGMKKRNFFGSYRFWLSFISCAGANSAPIPPMVYSPQKKDGGEILVYFVVSICEISAVSKRRLLVL